MADALIIGHMGQGPYLARAQAEYMKRQPRPYMRLVRAVMENDLLSESLHRHTQGDTGTDMLSGKMGSALEGQQGKKSSGGLLATQISRKRSLKDSRE